MVLVAFDSLLAGRPGVECVAEEAPAGRAEFPWLEPGVLDRVGATGAIARWFPVGEAIDRW